MKNLLDLIRRKTPAKTADLRAALAGLPTDAATSQAVAALEAERRTALIDGLVDADVAAIETKITAAVRERDRVRAYREELTAQLDQAEQLEAVDALGERKARAEMESRDIAKRFGRFEEHLGELVDMLRADEANRIECSAVDTQLAALGSTDRCTRAPRPSFGVVEAYIPRFAPAPKETTR